MADAQSTAETTASSSTSDINAAALFAAVGALATGIGSLAATGLLGQIERDHATSFSIALGLTVGGTFLAALAASGLLGRTDRRGVTILRVVGSVAICAGVLVAVLAAVATASDVEKPVIDVTVTPVPLPSDAKAASKTYLIDAETKAGNLPANARVTILVDGLHFDAHSKTYAPTNLFQGKYGPNNDGVLDIHSRVQVTRGDSTDGTAFNAIGVQARVAFAEQQTEPNPCGDYEKQVSAQSDAQAQARAQLDPGCVVVRLPARVVADNDVSTSVAPGSHHAIHAASSSH